jgi:competence ComEA-like helix-hairpin-helix protein
MKKELLILLTLIFLFSEISALCEEGQININSASLGELDKISWVGPATAQKIIDARPFSSVDDLINVSGIGEKKLEDIKNQSLACVSNQEVKPDETDKNNPNNQTEEDSLQSDVANNKNIINNEESKIVKISAKVIQNTTKEEVKTIILTPKDIKSETDKEQLNKNKPAIYGLVIFCILLVFLFASKKRNKEKNEFK